MPLPSLPPIAVSQALRTTRETLGSFPLLFDFPQADGAAVAHDDDGLVGAVGDKHAVGGEVENGVIGDACGEVLAVEALVDEAGGVGDGFGEGFDFGLGELEGGEGDGLAEDFDLVSFGEGGGEYLWCFVGVGF
jgi:hypothetical protein